MPILLSKNKQDQQNLQGKLILIFSKAEAKQEGGKGDVRKPKFTNSRGVQNKEGVPVKNESKTEKYDAPKKFVNTSLLNKAAEENTKIKAPTKDYLDATTKTKYKEENAVEIEKPKFLAKNDGNEPHFRDINKNEDVKTNNF